jgi:hypothetical protein
MIRISEFAGLLAGLTLFLGTLIAAQAYISHDAPDLRAELVQARD